MARRLAWIAAGCALWIAASPLSAAAAGAAKAKAAASPPALPAKVATVAILPIVVHSQAGEAYLRDGLADMLASRLGRAPGISVIRVGDPAKATSDEKKAREAAASTGAGWVLFGSFTHFGEGASLDMRCLPVKADDEAPGRSIFIQSGTLGQIIPRLDSLTSRIARYVKSGGQVGQAQVKIAPEQAASREEVDALRRRVEALEDQVRELAKNGQKSHSGGGGERRGEAGERR